MVIIEDRPHTVGVCSWEVVIEFNHVLDPEDVDELKDLIMDHCKVADVNEQGNSGLIVTLIPFVQYLEEVERIARQVCKNIDYTIASLKLPPLLFEPLSKEFCLALVTYHLPMPADCTQN